jgi:hypothetical protein
MLGNLFPNLFGGNENGRASLAVGNKPELLNGTERADFQNVTNLSSNPTPTTVNNAAKLAGVIEARTVLLKEESAQLLEAQRATLANLDVRVAHSQKSMENTKQFQKKMSKHGKNILEHQIGTEATKQNFDAYEQQFSGVTIDI